SGPAAEGLVWRLLTMKNRFRPLFGVHLATVLLVGAGASVLYIANTRPSSTVLGHVTSFTPPIAPGLWIMGDDYGWPWVYRTESFKTEDVAIKDFDRFEWKSLIADVAVGVAILVGIAVVAESILRWRATPRGGFPTT